MLEDVLRECQNDELNADTVEKLLALQSDALAQNEFSVYFEATKLLAKYYESNQDYDQAILLLKTPLEKELSEDYHPTVALVDQLIGLLLKTEDFAQLEKILVYRARFLEQNSALKRMQQFYLAVCYEGLKMTDKAIETLLAIPDTLSNSNLVSKYLKLAMLYLDKKDFFRSMSMAEYAIHFDPEQKNSIFHLVKSDLAYAQGDYVGALDLFQAYFLLSKVKNRYLDRFIRINLRLGRLEEAWSFFTEYLPKVDKMISKHTRRSFYEAGMDLCLDYQQMDMLLTLKDKIARLDRPLQETIDSYQAIEWLLKRSASRFDDQKYRDVLLEHYRDLMEQATIQRLVFFHLHPDGIQVMTYNKGLLMERLMTFSQLKGTLIDLLLDSDQDDLIYTRETLANIPDYLEPQSMIDAEYLIAARIRQEVYPNAFLLAFLADQTRFFHTQKLVRTTRILIEMRLSVSLFKNDLRQRSTDLEKGLGAMGAGIIKIEKGIVRFLSEYTKAIFSSSNDTVPFERFQTGFVSDKPIYLDFFLHRDQATLGYRLPDGQLKQLSFRIWRDECRILMTVKDITQAYSQTSKLTSAGLEDYLYGIKPINLIPAEYRQISSGQTILALQVEGLHLAFANSLEKDPLAFGEGLEKLVKESGKRYLVDFYCADPEHFVLILGTTDKRVIERIAKDVMHLLPELLKPEHPIKLSFAAHVVTKPANTESIKTQLLHLLYQDHSPDHGVHYLGRSELEMASLMESIAMQITHLIETKRVDLEYHPIGSWATRKIRWLEATLASDIGFHSPDELWNALEKAELLDDYLQAFVSKLSQDIHWLFPKEGNKPESIILRLSKSYCRRPLVLDKLVKTLKAKRLSGDKMMLAIEYDRTNEDRFWAVVSLFKNLGYPLALTHWFSDWPGSRLDELQAFSIAFVHKDDVATQQLPWLKWVKEHYQGCLVYEHETATLKKSMLTEMDFYYVKGAIFPPIKTPSELTMLESHPLQQTTKTVLDNPE